MQQKLRAMGAQGTALGGRLEPVEQAGIGEILGEKAQELRLAEGLEIAGQAEPDGLAIIAGDDRQQVLGLAPQRVAAVEQARDGGVDRIDDAGGLHTLKSGPSVVAHMRAERRGLSLVELRQRDRGGLAPGAVTDLAPAQRPTIQARQMARMLDHVISLVLPRGIRRRRPSSPSRPRHRRGRAA